MCSSIDLLSYGWQKKNDKLEIVWDSQENLQQVQKTVEYLTKGCKCRTGCSTFCCRCKKQSLQCGPTCHCTNCKNTSRYVTQNEETEQEIQQEIHEEVANEDENDFVLEGSTDEESGMDKSDRLDELNQEVDQMMEEIFGVKF